VYTCAEFATGCPFSAVVELSTDAVTVGGNKERPAFCVEDGALLWVYVGGDGDRDGRAGAWVDGCEPSSDMLSKLAAAIGSVLLGGDKRLICPCEEILSVALTMACNGRLGNAAEPDLSDSWTLLIDSCTGGFTTVGEPSPFSAVAVGKSLLASSRTTIFVGDGGLSSFESCLCLIGHSPAIEI